VSNLTGVPQIWMVDSKGGWPELVTALDDPVGGVIWSPDGKWLAFSVSPGGGMNGQVQKRLPGSIISRDQRVRPQRSRLLGIWEEVRQSRQPRTSV
jgi:Tol biopolymer transport system component